MLHNVVQLKETDNSNYHKLLLPYPFRPQEPFKALARHTCESSRE